MAEGGNNFGDFDPCECIFSQGGAMQRLINMLRSTQNVCNDNECFDMSNNGNGSLVAPNPNTGISLFMLFIGWIMLVVFLYFLRPSTLRRSRQVNQKDSNQPDDSNNNPPTPEMH